MGSIGERLRREREKQGISLDEVCSSTKINTRMLRAIEEEKFDQLPGGIFNKGFVRAYARHLNLDEQQAVEDYLSAAGLLVAEPVAAEGGKLPAAVAAPPVIVVAKEAAKPAVEVRPVVETKRQEQPAKNGKGKHAPPQAAKPRLADALPQPPKKVKPVEVKSQPKPVKQKPARVAPEVAVASQSTAERIPWGRLAFALLLIAFGVAIWGSFARESEEGPSSRPVATPASKPATADPKPLQDVSAAAPQVTIPVAEASPMAAAVNSSQAATAQIATAPTAQPQLAAPAAASATAAPAAEPRSFKIVVQARQDSWVSITADGREVMSQVLGAPSEKAIEAHKEIVIKVGNAGGVDILFNGKKVPPQGDYDQVKVLTFDPNGLETPGTKTTAMNRPAA